MVELLLALLTTLTGISRDQDPELMALAQQRAVQITTNFSHDGVPPNTAEVIAWNRNPDPVTTFALQWQGSPPHWAILTDPNLTRWGCGISQAGDAFYGACLFRSGPAITSVPAPTATVPAPTPEPAPPILLPDTGLLFSDTLASSARARLGIIGTVVAVLWCELVAAVAVGSWKPMLPVSLNLHFRDVPTSSDPRSV